MNGEYSRVWADGGTSFKRRWTVKFKFDAIRCKKKKVARKISLYEALFHLVTMMREEKFIGGRETKGREYNQSACNFFFVYKETRTMVDESLILSKRKKKRKHWSLTNFYHVGRVFVKFPTDWIFRAAELHLSK